MAFAKLCAVYFTTVSAIQMVQPRNKSKKIQPRNTCQKSVVVGDWQQVMDVSISKWKITMVNETSTCALQKPKNKNKIEKHSKRVVVDYRGVGMNENATCATKPVWTYVKNQGYSCEPALEGTLSDKIKFVAAEAGAVSRHIAYTYSIPDACKKNGSKAPCPMLIAIPGAKGATTVQCLLADENCVKEQGVVMVFPEIDGDAERNDTALAGMKFCNFEDMEFMRSLIQSFTDEHDGVVDKDRIMLFGQSMGATAAVWGALRQPDIYSHVYSASPKSFWRADKVPGCVHSGLVPQTNYSDFLENSKNIWQNRSVTNVKKLQRFVIFMGADDLLDDESSGPAQFNTLPNMIDDLGVASAEVKTEIRIYPGLPHQDFVAALNEAYNMLWRGVRSEDDGWGKINVA